MHLKGLNLNLNLISLKVSKDVHGKTPQPHQQTHKKHHKNAEVHTGLIKGNPSSLTRKIAQWKSQIETGRKDADK